jgi:hypothetical protein
MHSPVHQLFMVAALNLVIASPFLAYLLQRRGFFGDRVRTVTIRQGLAIPLAIIAAAAGAVTLAGVPAQSTSDPNLGLVLGAAAVFQLAWAVRWLRRPSARLAIGALLVTVVALAIWGVSRTVGLPLGAHAWTPEVVGVGDAFAAMFELALVIGLAAELWRPVRRALERRVVAAEAASLGVMMTIVAVSLLALFGIVSGGAVAVAAAV